MGYAARMMGLVVVWAGMAIGVEQDHPVPAHAQLHRALQQHLYDQRLRYFGALPFAEEPATGYRVHREDLNDDGDEDALVLMLGRYWGGTGGQTLFVFRGAGQGFHFVSHMTCITGPMPGSVCVTRTRSGGWYDLAVRVKGGEAGTKYARMTFNGNQYPLNPTVRPVMSEFPRGNFVLLTGDATRKALGSGGSYYRGVLGKTMRIQMRLEHTRGQVKGAYFYEKYGHWITLSGEASGKSIRLDEQSGGQVKATLALTHHGNVLSGAWQQSDGTRRYPVTLHLAARDTVKRTVRPLESSHETTFPHLTGKPGVYFNATLKAVFLERYQRDLEFWEPRTGDADLQQDADLRMQFQYFYDICYLSEDLLSVRGSDYQYTGGAHGLFHYFPVNFWIPDTRLQPLELEDLFSPNSSWRRKLAAHIRRDLIDQQAQWVVDGTVKVSDLLEDPVFTVSPSGVSFAFGPYAVGPYSQGTFEVTVPMHVLSPLVARDGPIGRWK